MRKTRRRPTVILDAGYVSVKAYDRYEASKIIGLHGKKLCCVIFTVSILFLISCINLTCVMWIMYKLDWSPFHKNGSKVFRFDQINQQIDFYEQGRFEEAIYTTRINDLPPVAISSERQMEIYGAHNSILLEEHRIAMNTEHFHMNEQSIVDFNNLYSLEFDPSRRTRIQLDRIKTHHIHSPYINLSTDNNITISEVNNVLFSGQHLIVTANRNDRRSAISFNGNTRRRSPFDHQQKGFAGNIDFRIPAIYLDLPRPAAVVHTHADQSGTFRICICNTTFLLLRSFAHQPCPLC